MRCNVLTLCIHTSNQSGTRGTSSKISFQVFWRLGLVFAIFAEGSVDQATAGPHPARVTVTTTTAARHDVSTATPDQQPPPTKTPRTRTTGEIKVTLQSLHAETQTVVCKSCHA